MKENAQDVRLHRFLSPRKSVLLGEQAQTNLIFMHGVNGVPIRGYTDTSQLTKQEIARLKTAWDIHIRVFDISDEKGVELYERLMTAASTKPEHVRVLREEWPERFGVDHWNVVIKWGECYLQSSTYRGIRMSDGNPLGDKG